MILSKEKCQLYESFVQEYVPSSRPNSIATENYLWLHDTLLKHELR